MFQLSQGPLPSVSHKEVMIRIYYNSRIYIAELPFLEVCSIVNAKYFVLKKQNFLKL
jgi:hypothetical protein